MTICKKIDTTYFSRNNLLIDLDRLICKERRVAGRHLINQDPKGPPVYSLVVALHTTNKRTAQKQV
jgi:hypothetical protein